MLCFDIKKKEILKRNLNARNSRFCLKCFVRDSALKNDISAQFVIECDSDWITNDSEVTALILQNAILA